MCLYAESSSLQIIFPLSSNFSPLHLRFIFQYTEYVGINWRAGKLLNFLQFFQNPVPIQSHEGYMKQEEKNETSPFGKFRIDAEQDRSISWRASEFGHFEKGATWYLIVGGATLILFVIAIWQRNFFFGIFIMLAGIMVVASGNRKPAILDYKLTEKGCEVGRGVFYEYGDLENFSLRNRPGQLDELVIKKKTSFNPFLRIPIDSHTAEKARIFLVQKLEEVEHKDSFLEILIDFLGF